MRHNLKGMWQVVEGLQLLLGLVNAKCLQLSMLGLLMYSSKRDREEKGEV